MIERGATVHPDSRRNVPCAGGRKSLVAKQARRCGEQLVAAIAAHALDVHGQYIEVLQDAATLTGDITAQSQQDDDDETPAGPLAIAVDVDEVPTAEATQP